MKLLKRTSDDEQLGEMTFAQRLEAIASRHKVGTALYDRKDEETSPDCD